MAIILEEPTKLRCADPSQSADQRVEMTLLAWIEADAMQPGDRFPAQAEIARKMRASPTTVHKAMSSLSRQGIVQRRPGAGTVLMRLPGAVGEQTGVSTPAGGAAIPRVGSLGLVLMGKQHDPPRDIHNTLWLSFRAAEKALGQELADAGTDIRIGSVRDGHELRGFVDESRMDGVLVLWHAYGEGSQEFRQARSLGLPVVNLLEAQDEAQHLPNVVVPDHVAMGALAARHLIELGHVHIMMACSDEDHGFEVARREGFVGVC
jgi:hypothetical protein